MKNITIKTVSIIAAEDENYVPVVVTQIEGEVNNKQISVTRKRTMEGLFSNSSYYFWTAGGHNEDAEALYWKLIHAAKNITSPEEYEEMVLKARKEHEESMQRGK